MDIFLFSVANMHVTDYRVPLSIDTFIKDQGRDFRKRLLKSKGTIVHAFNTMAVHIQKIVSITIECPIYSQLKVLIYF